MRPGVFVDFQVYSLRRSDDGRTVGIAAPAGSVSSVKAVWIDSLEAAQEQFGADSAMTALLTAAMENCGDAVLAAAFTAGNAAQYQAAVNLLCQSEAYCIVCGGAGIPEGAADAAAQKRKLLFASVPDEADGAALAAQINSERVVLTAPALCAGEAETEVSAAVVAALAAAHPGDSLLGKEIFGDYQAAELDEDEIQRLLRGCVTVLENGPVCPEVIRGLTTRGGKGAYRSIGAMTALDQVVRRLGDSLEERFSAGNGRLTLDAVRSQVECELMACQEDELISDWDAPAVVRDSTDPGCCQVSVGLRLRQEAVQIHLLASVGI